MFRDFLNRISSYVDPSQPIEPPKRNILIIHCHPVNDSYSNALLNAVTSGLRKSGQNIRIRRLYSYPSKEESYSIEDNGNFSPALTREERQEYMAGDNITLRETEEGMENLPVSSSEIKKAVRDLRWANAIVFVYPTWWFNFPAALKGYFDRVMLPGVAFKLPSTTSDSSKTTRTGLLPGLVNISKIGVVTVRFSSLEIIRI